MEWALSEEGFAESKLGRAPSLPSERMDRGSLALSLHWLNQRAKTRPPGTRGLGRLVRDRWRESLNTGLQQAAYCHSTRLIRATGVASPPTMHQMGCRSTELRLWHVPAYILGMHGEG